MQVNGHGRPGLHLKKVVRNEPNTTQKESTGRNNLFSSLDVHEEDR